jgi:threonine dehydrogenase-like Zn-dependent dehydrogenase
VPSFGQPLVIEDRPVPEPGPGQVVSGVGGLGRLAVQYAKIFGVTVSRCHGVTVAVVDITDEKLKPASELGADIVIDSRDEDPAEVLRQHGGADIAIGLSGCVPRGKRESRVPADAPLRKITGWIGLTGWIGYPLRPLIHPVSRIHPVNPPGRAAAVLVVLGWPVRAGAGPARAGAGAGVPPR